MPGGPSSKRHLCDDGGTVAVIFALALIPIVLAVGMFIDLARLYNKRTELQAALDSALLAVSARYSSDMSDADIAQVVSSFVAVNFADDVPSFGTPELDSDGAELCVSAEDSIAMTFMQLAKVETMPLKVRSCATMTEERSVEIALVLDVSSSMIENDRFAPLQAAVQRFLDDFSASSKLASRTKISIVPFSSRINIGLEHTSWLKSYGGNAAVPTRWTNPYSVYSSSSYSRDYWIDGVTPVMYNSKNYYWMGCIEPREDVEVKDNGGSAGPYGFTDATPTASAFVAMDSNSGSSQSFCPPPITPLSNDYATLSTAVSKLTSEGSTRLDAGVMGGWYTLSPKWRGVWGSDTTSPADYSSKVHKVMVFMTDGWMNTQYGKSSGKLDWFCTYSQSTTTSSVCNDAAYAGMLSICDAMKSNGIEIYTLSYGDSADTTNIAKCATDTSYYYAASTSDVNDIYEAIARAIRGRSVRIVQ
ncbi:pilus assembly protein [Jiella sp. MQZ13P-4]|uniref:Pilus assembly protein n=2 Tax=Jiella sonneratiae TaxID=2816856 RepID=A0ABS3JBH1_9HYPH|nr:pilus assembly protein [Jiella sonneratiae]